MRSYQNNTNLFPRGHSKDPQNLQKELIEQVKKILGLDVILMCSHPDDAYSIIISNSSQKSEDIKTIVDILTKYDPTGEVYANDEKTQYKNYGIIETETAYVIMSGTLHEITRKFQLHIDSLAVRQTSPSL